MPFGWLNIELKFLVNILYDQICSLQFTFWLFVVDKVVVDMTTSEPSLAKEIYEVAKKNNNQSIDAPVSGGDIGAKEARLSIMIGGGT